MPMISRERQQMEIIGDLHGAKVLIDRATRSVIIASDDINPIKFSIDHPLIQGTKLERDARAALSNGERP
jgi:hypothetical protein